VIPYKPRRTKIKKTQRKIKASPRRRRRNEKISKRVFPRNEKEKIFLFLGCGN